MTHVQSAFQTKHIKIIKSIIIYLICYSGDIKVKLKFSRNMKGSEHARKQNEHMTFNLLIFQSYQSELQVTM